VGGRTRDEKASPIIELPEQGNPPTVEIAVTPKLTGFAGGSRFVVFGNGDHAIVVDTSTDGRAFDVDGRPMTTDNNTVSAFDEWMQLGLSPAHLPQKLVASDKGTLLVKTADSIEAVDLLNRGALIAQVKTNTADAVVGASIAPDGSMFAIWTKDSLQLVRTEDEEVSTFALQRPPPQAATDFAVTWNASADTVMWRDAEGVRVVQRSTLEQLHVSMANAKVSVSKDGKTFVVSHSPERDMLSTEAELKALGRAPGVVEVWRMGDSKPRARFTSAFVTRTAVSDDGHRVAWSEISDMESDPAQATHLHSLDIDTGVHARFVAAGGCGNVFEEYLVGIEGDTIKTDAECSPGCPSNSHQSDFISYDFASGRVNKRVPGEHHAPYNDTLSAHRNTIEDLGKRLHFMASDGQAPLIHHPKKSSVLFIDPVKDITLITESAGNTIAKLDDSTGFHAADVHFSPDGARIVGVSEEGYLAIWRTDDGHRLWSQR